MREFSFLGSGLRSNRTKGAHSLLGRMCAMAGSKTILSEPYNTALVDDSTTILELPKHGKAF